MKISIEQANKLLSALLGDATVAENDNEADNDIQHDALLSAIHENITKILRPSVEEQVKPTLEAAFTGRYLGALRSAAQRVFNVPKRELEDMTIEQLLTKCKAVHDVRAGQDEDSKQATIEATVQDYETQIEQLKAEYETRLTEAHDKYVQRDIASRCISIIEKLPRKGGDLREQADMLRYKMQAVYEVRYNDEKQQLEFYKEGKPVTGEGNQPVTDEDFARNWAEKAGILVNDTRHIAPADVKAGLKGAYATGVIAINDEDQADDTMQAIAAWADTQ